jgi:hypothetical protein
MYTLSNQACTVEGKNCRRRKNMPKDKPYQIVGAEKPVSDRETALDKFYSP